MQLDHFYPFGASWFPVLAAIDVDTGYGACTTIPTRSADRFSVGFIKQFLLELGINEFTLQTDQEPAVMELARMVAASSDGKVSVRTTPRASSASNGSVERFSLSAQELGRTLIAHVEACTNTSIGILFNYSSSSSYCCTSKC